MNIFYILCTLTIGTKHKYAVTGVSSSKASQYDTRQYIKLDTTFSSHFLLCNSISTTKRNIFMQFKYS